MNKEKFILSCVSVFAFIFLFDWVMHDFVIKNLYEDTSSLWRDDEEILVFLFWRVFGQLILAVFFCLIFLHGYEKKGLGEGARYGFLIGLLMTAPVFIQFAVQPLPTNLLVSWLVGGVLELILAGVILAAIYRPAKN